MIQLEKFNGKKYDLSTKEGITLFRKAAQDYVEATITAAKWKRIEENIAERDRKREEKKQLEAEGKLRGSWTPTIRAEPVIIPEPEPEPEPEPPKPKLPEDDPKDAEIIKLREQLAALEALKESNKEIIEEVPEEDGESTSNIREIES